MTRKWHGVIKLGPRMYDCGYCGVHTGPDEGTFSQEGSAQSFIYVCSNCGQPTFFDYNGRQFPGPKFGNDVKHLSDEIRKLYDEARAASSAQAYTPAVLACRKILMNVAVSLGAKEGGPFVSYVSFLADKGYVPPNGKHWVDHIRTKSNEANHEIALMSKEEAERLITFVEMMLKFIYELPNVVPVSVPQA
jgi:hypothetical protein